MREPLASDAERLRQSQLTVATEPLRRSRPPRPAFFWFTLVASAVYLFLFAFAAYEATRYFGLRKDTGWSARATLDGWFVATVDPAGPAAGRLERGDRLLAINGDDRSAVLGTYRLLDVNVGDTYDMTVDRLGNRISLALPVLLVPANPFQSLFLIYALAFFACGAGLGILRPDDAQVRLIGGTMMMAGASMLDAVGSLRAFLVGWERVVCFAILCLSGWTFPMAYHFFSRFPTWSSPGPPWTSLQWLLYTACLVVFWPSWVVSHMVGLAFWDPAMDFFAARPFLLLTAASIAQRDLFLYGQVCILLALLVTARNYRRLRDPGSRRRIRWVVAGLTVACTPWLALMFAFWAVGWVSAATYGVLYPLVSATLLCACRLRSSWPSGKSSCSTFECSYGGESSTCSRGPRCGCFSWCRLRCSVFRSCRIRIAP